MTTRNCVDCGVTILGERPRCPACHARHATSLLYAGDAFAPRRGREHTGMILLRWLVVAQLVAAVVLGMIIVIARGCP